MRMDSWLRKNGINPLMSFFSKYCGYFFLLIITIGFGVALLFNRFDWFLKSLVIGIPGLIAAIYLIFVKKIPSFDQPLLFTLNNKIINISFIGLYCISIYLVFTNPYRIWLYFIVLALMACMVFVKIFNKTYNKNLILFYCFTIMVNLSFCVTLNYVYYFGTTDLFFHIHFSEVVQQWEHVLPSEFELTYASHPLLYIYVAINSIVTNISIKSIYFLSLGIIYSSTVFVVYKIFSVISDNERMSLLACLLYCFSSAVVMYGVNLITRTMAYVGFLLLFYLFLKYKSMDRIAFYMLFLIITSFILLVHQVSIFQIISVLMIIFIVELFVTGKTTIKIQHLFLLGFFTATYWIYLNYDLTSILISTRLDYIESGDTTRIITTELDTLNQRTLLFIYSNISYAIVTLLTLVGIGVLLKKNQRNLLEVIAVFSLIMSVIYIPNPLQMIYGVWEIFRADRLQLMVAPFFAFIIGCGLIAIFSTTQFTQKNKLVFKIAAVFIIFIFSFYSISTFLATDCEDLNKDQFPNFPRYLNAGEYQGILFTQNFIPFGSTLRSDNFVNQYYRFKKSQISKDMKLPYYTINNLIILDNAYHAQGYDIIRYNYFIKNGLFLYLPDSDTYQSLKPDTNLISNFNEKIVTQNFIYNSKYVYICKNMYD